VFERLRKETVYCSKDREDWEKARSLLDAAGLRYQAWESEEAPVGGCGGKIDHRTFMNGKKTVPKTIFRIQISLPDAPAAKAALEGQVKPVQHYGT
jgi:hypothetical protein